MRRFFVAAPLEQHMVITGEDYYHITKVLRMSIGDSLIAVSPDGQSALAEIMRIDQASVHIILQQYIAEKNEPPIRVFLAQSLPKSDKMDYIVQKSVELGVHAIIPMETTRCVVRYDTNKREERVRRWRRIAEEAAKQCGRSVVPEVASMMSLQDVLSHYAEKMATIMLYEEKSVQMGIKHVLASLTAKNYLLLIGSEGGFTPDEFQLCQQHQAYIATLGPRILRTETAALASLAVVMYHCGDLGTEEHD